MAGRCFWTFCFFLVVAVVFENKIDWEVFLVIFLLLSLRKGCISWMSGLLFEVIRM